VLAFEFATMEFGFHDYIHGEPVMERLDTPVREIDITLERLE
jgi:hypothetical protein